MIQEDIFCDFDHFWIDQTVVVVGENVPHRVMRDIIKKLSEVGFVLFSDNVMKRGELEVRF